MRKELTGESSAILSHVFFHCSLMVSYEGLADEYLKVPHSKCCSQPEKVQKFLIQSVSVHGKTAEDERDVSVGSANAVSICSAVA